MEAHTLSRRIRGPITQLATIVFIYAAGATSLLAQPTVANSYFDEGVIEVVNEVNTMTGAKGNLCFLFTVEYNNVSLNSIGEGDIKVVGISETNMNQEIPVTFRSRRSGTPLLGIYEIGPLVASANGLYSIQIVEDAVTDWNEPPNAVPAEEIFRFDQDITDPMPEILRIHPLEIDGIPVTEEGNPVDIAGAYGNALVTMFIDFNNDTDPASVNNVAFEIKGVSGAAADKVFAIQRRNVDTTPEDYFTVEYIFGRLDSTANGTYSVQVVEGTIHGIGKTNDPPTHPAGEVLSINVNVFDPPPAILTEIDGGWPVQYFPIVAESWDHLIVYYNLSVDPAEIDNNDLIVTGISESNMGEILQIGGEFSPANVYVDDSIWSSGYITATYSLDANETPKLTESNNGLWKVELREGEVVDKMSPANAIPAGIIGEVRTAVVDPFTATVEGRIYQEKENTTPSLTDDGFETDPGLPLSISVESPLGGGIATLTFWVDSSTVIFDEQSTHLQFEIHNAVKGNEPEGYFEIKGTAQNFFWASPTFTISGSPGNDGTYTFDYISYNDETNTTKVFVQETIESDEAGGLITKGEFVTTIVIDGVEFPIAFTAEEIPTFSDFFLKINEILDGAGFIYMRGGNSFAIDSCSFGPDSTVEVIEPDETNGLIRHLTGTVPFHTAQGNLDWGFGGQDQYFPDDGKWDSARDTGRFRFSPWHPGIFRINVYIDIVEWEDEEGIIFWEELPPPPEYVLQGVGDPFREGEPEDHTRYLLVKRSMKGQSLIVNFSYLEEMDPPHVKEDVVQVLIGGSGTLIDVLRNDGLPEGNSEDLTIIGLSPWLDETLLQVDPPPPTEIFGGNQRLGNRIWTDGDFVYYDSPGFEYESFYYVVEDSEGRRDFTWVATQPVSEIVNKFFANDDFATVPITEERARINVLANDAVEEGGSKDDLVITHIAPTTAAGGTVSYQGTDVFYQPPPDFLGADSFEYTMTDGFSGTATATVSITVTNSPVPEGQRALLNLLLFLFGGSRNGSAVFEFWNRHISEVDYLILDQGEGSVAAKANGNLPLSRRHNGGTAETQATWNTILDMAETGIAATLAGQGDTVVVTQEFVDLLMAGIEDVQARASPDLKADLQEICDMTNDFQDLVGKTFGEGFTILGLPPESISIPNLALERINDVISITTWDVAGLALKLWKSNDLQPDSWEEVQNAEIVKEGAMATISDPDVGDEDVFYRVTSEVE